MTRTASLLCVLLAASAARAETVADLVTERAGETLPPDLAIESVVLAPTLRNLEPVRVAVSWRRSPRAGRVTVWVTAQDGDGSSVRGWARIELRELRSVLVAARALGAGDELRAGDVTLELRTVARGEGWELTPSTLTGRTVLRKLAAGAVIGGGDIERPPPVARGTEVTVVVQVGAVTIEAPALLERNARPGERTSARLTGSRRVVRGRLRGPSIVVVEGARR